jgi:cyclophilin family peptidyl-prolyl cis-trans isomerase
MQCLTTFLPRLLVLLLLSACGGGDSVQPAVSQIQATTLRYGQSAVIQLAGKYMRQDMVAQTGSCTGPAFRSDSTPDLAVLTCQVSATGPLTVTIRAADGALLHTATLTVPLPQVLLVTSKGSIEMELNPTAAPLTVNNFLGYVNRGYYRNTLFHRVMPGFVVQGGGYTTGMVKKDGQLAPIVLESNTGLLNARGTVAMARTSEPNSATSEFFVNLVNNTSLDYQNANSLGYAVFGKVVSGMDVVDAIAAMPTATVGPNQNVPTTDVTISLALQTR